MPTAHPTPTTTGSAIFRDYRCRPGATVMSFAAKRPRKDAQESALEKDEQQMGSRQ
jgi:hypothetical protein